MTQNTLQRIDIPAYRARIQSEYGFSFLEMLISLCILLPIMAGALELFSVGVKQQGSEQSSVEATQDASAGFDMMTMEIAQAGSNSRTFVTSTTGSITGDPYAEASVTVDDSSGFKYGDVIEIYDPSTGSTETVQLAAVSTGSITGIFQKSHYTGSRVQLLSLPFLQGVLPPSGLTANSDTSVSEIKFFGDIYGDGDMNYAEYVYDSDNAQITRSITPLTALSKRPAVPLITNIKANSAEFILHTDSLNVITSVTVSLTVENEWETSSKLQEIPLSSKVKIVSAETASALQLENLHFGPVNTLPSTPSRISLLRGIEF